MRIVTIIILLGIIIYTSGFAVTLWKQQQKISALAVLFLALAIAVLPFFSIL